MNQPNRAKQPYASAPWRDMTTVASRSAVHFQKRPEFSQKLLNFSLNFSDTNQNNQSGRFLVLQEEQHE